MFRPLALFVLAVLSSGCANYWSARGRDTLDLVTLTATTGAGVKFEAGPVQVAPVAMLVDLGGIRGGEVFSAEIGEKETVFPMDVGTLWWSSSIFALPSVPRVEERGKAYCAFPVGAQSEQLFDRHAVSVPFVSLPRATWSEENLELARVSTAYYGQVELALALGGGFRVGTNVFEWVDFACGWFGIDPLADDMGRDASKGELPPRPVLRVPDSDRVGK